MQFQSIASGSNGNCSVWDTSQDAILFDAGVSRKRIINGLKTLEIKPSKVKYVCITHAHWDHINGLPVLMDYLKKAKVVATSETIEELIKLKTKDSRFMYIANKAIPVEFHDTIQLSNKFEISCFPAEHDIDGASGFRVNQIKTDFAVSYVTDTAAISSDFVEAMSDSDLFFLESNHDNELLDKSRRPYWLKNRIRKTHLSNNKFLELSKQIISDRTKVAYLGHLSGECNDENLVYNQMAEFSKKYPINWVISTRSRESSIFKMARNILTIEGGLSNFNDDRNLDTSVLDNYF
ncbi:MAG: MBL fold metallo-hydrolase [Candidatus Kariarchaeaceae archaeon]